MVSTNRVELPKIAGYTTEAILGEGGMATVYLAVQQSLSRHVALKVMMPLLMVDQDFCRRFLNEGRLIAKLSHPNIVTVYDIGTSDYFHYLSMTYLSGGTLKEKIRRGLPVGETIHIVKCLADALGYAHKQGVVHRDIKPGNVLFTHSGVPVLTDFGIAKTVENETRLTSTGVTVGSVGYMSPEQSLGLDVDSRSDLYSLGVLFWQMLTGTLPYAATDPFAVALKHANDPIPKLPGHLKPFQPVIEGLMAKKASDRLASAEELVRVLNGIPYEDTGAQPARSADQTTVLPRVPDMTSVPRPAVVRGDGVPDTVPRRRFGLVTTVLAVAVLTAVSAFVGYDALFKSAAESPNQHLPASQGARHSDREELLRKAESQWKAGRLIEPAGDNAFESYSRVLALDPDDQVAKQALVEIGRINAANKVFQSADALLRQGAMDEARRMIETGLKINPNDEHLLGLRRALDYGQ
jgi:serine/threonine-protein kinase PpkA